MRTTGCSEFDFARLFLPAHYRQEQGHARPLRTFGLRNPEPQEEHRLTPARSFASPARTHDTNRNRNRFSGWTHPPNLQPSPSCRLPYQPCKAVEAFVV